MYEVLNTILTPLVMTFVFFCYFWYPYEKHMSWILTMAIELEKNTVAELSA